MLYAMRDPGNLGSVIRSAVAFGADHILMSADCADIYNPKTVRAAMGSLFRVRMTSFTNVPEMVKAVRCSGRRVFAAELSEHAVSLTEAGLLPPDVRLRGGGLRCDRQRGARNTAGNFRRLRWKRVHSDFQSNRIPQRRGGRRHFYVGTAETRFMILSPYYGDLYE